VGGGLLRQPRVKAPQAVATVAAGTSVVTGIVSMSFKIASGTRPQVFESAYTEYSGTAVSSWAATLATTPDPADVLICAVLHNDTLGAASITGCGATWTVNEVNDTAAKFDMHVWTGVNPTGAGRSRSPRRTRAPARSGCCGSSGVGQSVTSAYNRTTGLSGTGPSVSAGPSQLVVALQALSGVGSADYPDHQRQPGARQLVHRRAAAGQHRQRLDARRLERTERPGCLHRDRDVGFRAGLAHRDGADRIGDDEMTDVAIAPGEDLTLQIPVTDADGNPANVAGADGDFLVFDAPFSTTVLFAGVMTVADAAGGLVSFTLPGSATASYGGEYHVLYFETWLVDGDQKRTRLDHGKLTLA
jgi:hypothetical protein